MASKVKQALDYTPRMQNTDTKKSRSMQKPVYATQGGKQIISQTSNSTTPSSTINNQGINTLTNFSQVNILSNNSQANFMANNSMVNPYPSNIQQNNGTMKQNHGEYKSPTLDGYSPWQQKSTLYQQNLPQYQNSASNFNKNEIGSSSNNNYSNNNKNEVITANYRVSNTYRPVSSQNFPGTSNTDSSQKGPNIIEQPQFTPLQQQEQVQQKQPEPILLQQQQQQSQTQLYKLQQASYIQQFQSKTPKPNKSSKSETPLKLLSNNSNNLPSKQLSSNISNYNQPQQQETSTPLQLKNNLQNQQMQNSNGFRFTPGTISYQPSSYPSQKQSPSLPQSYQSSSLPQYQSPSISQIYQSPSFPQAYQAQMIPQPFQSPSHSQPYQQSIPQQNSQRLLSPQSEPNESLSSLTQPQGHDINQNDLNAQFIPTFTNSSSTSSKQQQQQQSLGNQNQNNQPNTEIRQPSPFKLPINSSSGIPQTNNIIQNRSTITFATDNKFQPSHLQTHQTSIHHHHQQQGNTLFTQNSENISSTSNTINNISNNISTQQEPPASNNQIGSTKNLLPNKSTIKQDKSSSTLAIKQSQPHSNNLHDLGINRKSQTPKRSYQTSNGVSPLFSNQQIGSVSTLFQNQAPSSIATLFSNKNQLDDKRIASPSRTKDNSEINPCSFTLLPVDKQNLPKPVHFHTLKPEKNNIDQSISPTKHKKSISDIDQVKDALDMFLIRDQDTGQVYDIRNIDKIDSFQKANNQEYFDKLKRRHKNAWQGWWNSKKENNIKMIQSVRKNSFSTVEQLLQHERADIRADTDFKDQNQWAGIHYAALNGSASILNLLILHDADINLVNNLEQTPLMIAAEKGFGEIVDICIKAGADVNKKDLSQNTALHISCVGGFIECIKILLKAKNINLSLRNQDGKLAQECCEDKLSLSLFNQTLIELPLQVKNKSEKTHELITIEQKFGSLNEGVITSPTLGTIQSVHGLLVNQNAETTLSGYQATGQLQSAISNTNIDSNFSHHSNNDGNVNSLNQNSSHCNLGSIASLNCSQSSQTITNYINLNSIQQPSTSLHTHLKNQNGLYRTGSYEPIIGSQGYYSQKITSSTNYGQVPNKIASAASSSIPIESNEQNNNINSQKKSFETVKAYSYTNSGVQSNFIQNNSGNRGSNLKSTGTGATEGSPNLHHTQSISSTGSSHSPQNMLSDSLTQSGQSSMSQPWKVIIHDFTNESVEQMFQESQANCFLTEPFGNINFSSNSNNVSNNNQTNQQNNMNSNNAKNFMADSKNSNNNENDINQTNKNSGAEREQLLPQMESINSIHQSSPLIPSKAQNQSLSMQQTKQSSQKQKKQIEQQESSGQLDQQKVGPDQFKIVNQIGRGSFGEVYLVEKKGTGIHFAMKILHKSKVLGQNLTKYAMTERNVLSIMSHPFIVKLMYAFQTSKDLFLIMEYMPGGDLSHALQRDKRFSEARARIYLVEILFAIRDLHKHDIIYRDLKPENIVIDSEGHAMLTDFGLSKDGVYDHYSTHSFCGSLAYLAPEMLKRCGHGKAVDYYHLGVLLYEMLTGAPPFFSESKDEICHNIEFQEIRFPSHVSDNARNLIQKLLVKNPAKRLGFGKNDFEEMKKHPFFQGINWNQAFQRKLKPPPPFIKPVVESKNTTTPNFMITMTPFGMMSDNHLSGWSFINSLEPSGINKNNSGRQPKKF